MLFFLDLIIVLLYLKFHDTYLGISESNLKVVNSSRSVEPGVDVDTLEELGLFTRVESVIEVTAIPLFTPSVYIPAKVCVYHVMKNTEIVQSINDYKCGIRTITNLIGTTKYRIILIHNEHEVEQTVTTALNHSIFIKRVNHCGSVEFYAYYEPELSRGPGQVERCNHTLINSERKHLTCQRFGCAQSCFSVEFVNVVSNESYIYRYSNSYFFNDRDIIIHFIGALPDPFNLVVNKKEHNSMNISLMPILYNTSQRCKITIKDLLILNQVYSPVICDYHTFTNLIPFTTYEISFSVIGTNYCKETQENITTKSLLRYLKIEETHQNYVLISYISYIKNIYDDTIKIELHNLKTNDVLNYKFKSEFKIKLTNLTAGSEYKIVLSSKLSERKVTSILKTQLIPQIEKLNISIVSNGFEISWILKRSAEYVTKSIVFLYFVKYNNSGNSEYIYLAEREINQQDEVKFISIEEENYYAIKFCTAPADLDCNGETSFLSNCTGCYSELLYLPETDYYVNKLIVHNRIKEIISLEYHFPDGFDKNTVEKCVICIALILKRYETLDACTSRMSSRSISNPHPLHVIFIEKNDCIMNETTDIYTKILDDQSNGVLNFGGMFSIILSYCTSDSCYPIVKYPIVFYKKKFPSGINAIYLLTLISLASYIACVYSAFIFIKELYFRVTTKKVMKPLYPPNHKHELRKTGTWSDKLIEKFSSATGSYPHIIFIRNTCEVVIFKRVETNLLDVDDFSDRVIGEENIVEKYTMMEQFTNFSNVKPKSCDIAQMTENISKNKIAHIIPGDKNRFIVNGNTDMFGYINASRIVGITYYYIAAQTPSNLEIIDFHRMIIESKCPTMVLITGKNDPDREIGIKLLTVSTESSIDSDYSMTVTQLETPSFVEPVLRNGLDPDIHNIDPFVDIKSFNITIKLDNVQHQFTLFHYKNWENHGVPDNFNSLLHLRSHLRTLRGETEQPMTVVSSGGSGRVGTFIAYDYNLRRVETADHTFSLAGYISKMRRARVGMVETYQQYEFLHALLGYALKPYVKLED